jgi:Fic family protein
MKQMPTINPAFDSELVTQLFALEKLRYSRLGGSTPPWLFYDLKEIMHILESVASARIEGNHTTVVGAAIDALDADKATDNEDYQELRNIRNAINYIEETMGQEEGIQPITPALIRDIQKIIVKGLKRDGSKTPGKWRTGPVSIIKSKHIPPEHIEVPALMQELCDYIEADNDGKHDIIKIALAHHRFAAIHPFDNGNGRTARMLTYAMLVKSKLINKTKRVVLNPSAIFCIDRERYYEMLSVADKGTPAALEKWCLYVAKGIAAEMDRVNRLLDKDYAIPNIIEPALRNALNSNYLSQDEYEIMKIATSKNIIQAADVKHLFGPTPSAAVQTSRVLASMREKKLIDTHPRFQKKYIMRFANNYLLQDVLIAMDKNGLLVVTNEA